jgi:hypothetical protein
MLKGYNVSVNVKSVKNELKFWEDVIGATIEYGDFDTSKQFPKIKVADNSYLRLVEANSSASSRLGAINSIADFTIFVDDLAATRQALITNNIPHSLEVPAVDDPVPFLRVELSFLVVIWEKE